MRWLNKTPSFASVDAQLGACMVGQDTSLGMLRTANLVIRALTAADAT